MVRCCYKHRHFENTKLLAGNHDHVIDIFTSENMENILRCMYFQYLTVNYIINNSILLLSVQLWTHGMMRYNVVRTKKWPTDVVTTWAASTMHL